MTKGEEIFCLILFGRLCCNPVYQIPELSKTSYIETYIESVERPLLIFRVWEPPPEGLTVAYRWFVHVRENRCFGVAVRTAVNAGSVKKFSDNVSLYVLHWI